MSIEGLSGSFSSYLENELRSDSESMPQDSGTDNLTRATASTSRSNSQQQQEAFLGYFQEYSDKTITAFESFQNKSNEMKKTLLDLQAQQASQLAATSEADRTRSNWDEYDRLSQRVIDMSTNINPRNKVLLRNLCSRVQAIEKLIGVDEASSVAIDVMKALNELDDN
jgi:hypothetical protein